MILTEQKQEWNILIDSTSLAAFSYLDNLPLNMDDIDLNISTQVDDDSPDFKSVNIWKGISSPVPEPEPGPELPDTEMSKSSSIFLSLGSFWRSKFSSSDSSKSKLLIFLGWWNQFYFTYLCWRLIFRVDNEIENT
jgi:hypothetical protein